MTAQISDTFILDGEPFTLISNLSRYIHPSTWGIEPSMMHTGCYRGYYATVQVADGQLTLHKLTVSSNIEEFPAINGVQPEIERRNKAIYSDLGLRLPFSGELIAARGFDQRHYQHMGFHPLSAYRTVVTLQLDDGWVTAREERQQDTSTNEIDRPPTGRSALLPSAGESSAEQARQEGVVDWIRERFKRP